MKDWTDEIIRLSPGDDKSDPKFKDKVRKHRDAAAPNLRMRGLIDMDGDFVWRTTRLVAGVDRPVREAPEERSELPPVDTSGVEF
jgi:hypothetical protein